MIKKGPIDKGFVVYAGGRHFRTREDSIQLPYTMLISAVLDLLFRECKIIGVESVDEPHNEGMMFVVHQNFGRLLLVNIEVDYMADEYNMTLLVHIAEAEEVK